MTKIIDVSNNNGHVDFAAAKRAGAVGVYLKVTEGTGFVDQTYLERRKAARAAGLKVGGYHFAHPGNSGAAEAAFFLKHLVYEKGDLVPMLDMETDSGRPKTYTSAFVAAVRKAHGHCGLYCGGWFIQKYGLQAYRPRWIPSYGAKPTMDYDAWQFSDGQDKYPGHIQHLDTSYVVRMDAMTGGTPAPKPKPPAPKPAPAPTPAPAPKPKPRPKKRRWVRILGQRVRVGSALWRQIKAILRAANRG